MNERTITVIGVREVWLITVPNMRGSSSYVTALIKPKKTPHTKRGEGVVPSWVHRRHFPVLRPRHACDLSLSCLPYCSPFPSHKQLRVLWWYWPSSSSSSHKQRQLGVLRWSWCLSSCPSSLGCWVVVVPVICSLFSLRVGCRGAGSVVKRGL